MSRNLAGKAPQRLSKFSKAGDETFRHERPAPFPAPNPDYNGQEPGGAIPEQDDPRLAVPSPDEARRTFSRFSEDRYALYEPVPQPRGFEEPAASFEQHRYEADNPYGDPGPVTPFDPREDEPLSPPPSRLMDELERLRQDRHFGYDEREAAPLRQDAAAASFPQEAAPRAAPVREQRKRIKAGSARLGRRLQAALPGAGAKQRVMDGFETAARVTRKGGAGSTRLARKSLAVVSNARSLIRFARAKKLSARYRMALALVHARLFDRRVERVLFVQSRRTEGEFDAAADSRDYHYDGPIPRLVLDWALSALPEDLKTYAFVDFRAGNGRTILLAARRNFEVIYGYAFDAQAHEDLEMNIAQYPRSLMSCRNLRAIRGDIDGVSIPEQPAVLFFPNSARERHLGIILNHVASSFRLNPRPLYLVFDKAAKDTQPEHEDIFEPVPIPIPNRLRLAILSPERVKLYRSVLVRGA